MIKHISTIKDKNGMTENIIIEADSKDFKKLTNISKPKNRWRRF